ncbi:MAG: hypothetical protein A2600_08705 [Candidatus Lambdaproteobacteria bacterium RIFOXYD1_FULL_56_27]|uniref:Hemerythrin-like domain-containing protein n=1 Tax=Candidatus Lambdaproteobacteria bacterium RIFOXYD2_FULL_56_26 TaxID=1817773 RepID=A0A1F6GZB2_9PROT|nr:MAG: hypothetical protein A2426_10125 [Candidatus Lambdaproteobacteria bacterium RIFOXYC1_FULL_56_13]OGH03384.1 MAG: hypothetical protein A2557_02560 [Candidatus Lambdaproteobacteria bacterium RIFOXYD2_FULL_56_26]OGH06611.1 MAG: hypothetical protein A2600_08705 [Candidatus Lambdaproteobacteria bacterium RIFOXYD1_FULL_56_27]
MANQEWNKALETGLLWQDHQHRRFFAIRDLLLKSAESADSKLFERTLVLLEHYVADHFSTEEAYMNETHYPELADHLKEHQTFAKMVQRAKREYLAYKKALDEGDDTAHNPWIDLGLDLEIWFVEHIRGSDHRLGEFLLQQNRP